MCRGQRDIKVTIPPGSASGPCGPAGPSRALRFCLYLFYLPKRPPHFSTNNGTFLVRCKGGNYVISFVMNVSVKEKPGKLSGRTGKLSGRTDRQKLSSSDWLLLVSNKIMTVISCHSLFRNKFATVMWRSMETARTTSTGNPSTVLTVSSTSSGLCPVRLVSVTVASEFGCGSKRQEEMNWSNGWIGGEECHSSRERESDKGTPFFGLFAAVGQRKRRIAAAVTIVLHSYESQVLSRDLQQILARSRLMAPQ